MAKVKLNRKAMAEFMKSPKVEAELKRRADRVAAGCGDGYVAVSGTGKTRARAAVITATGAAIRDNAKNNTLIKNLDAARD